MTKTIALLNPVVDTGAVPMASIARYNRRGLSISMAFLDEGPLSVETAADIAACTPGVLSLGATLAAEGADAIIVNCMCDPAVAALRERVSIPVLGPAEASMHYAAAIGLRFGMIDVVDDARAEAEAQVHRYGLDKMFAAYRAIGIPVLDLHADPDRTLAAAAEAAHLALGDGASCLLLGCTGFADLADALTGRLSAEGISCPVIEPLGVTLTLAGLALGASLD